MSNGPEYLDRMRAPLDPDQAKALTTALRVPHTCRAEPGWYCEQGDEYGPCSVVRPSDGCQDPECNRYVGRCACACHKEQQ